MKIVFICLGNICRSPMAEYIFKSILEDKDLSNKYLVESRATSYEEDVWKIEILLIQKE